MSNPVNEYGLTFEEWLATANSGYDQYLDCERTRGAWLDGEDPTEWCYFAQAIENESKLE